MYWGSCDQYPGGKSEPTMTVGLEVLASVYSAYDDGLVILSDGIRCWRGNKDILELEAWLHANEEEGFFEEWYEIEAYPAKEGGMQIFRVFEIIGWECERYPILGGVAFTLTFLPKK